MDDACNDSYLSGETLLCGGYPNFANAWVMVINNGGGSSGIFASVCIWDFFVHAVVFDYMYKSNGSKK